MRRTLIIIVITLLVLAVGILGYQLFAKPATQGTTGTGTTDFFSALFPFGNTGTTTGGGGNNGGGDTGGGTQTSGNSLIRQVTAEMVSGARFISVASSTPFIRYMERKTGHIYDIPADGQTAMRITNTTVPGIIRMVWLSDTTAILESLSDTHTQENFLGKISTSTQVLSGTLMSGFSTAAVHDTTLVLATKRTGGSLIETSGLDGSNRQTVFASPFTSWIPLIGGKKIFLASAPSAETEGYLYELINNAPVKVAGGLPGFMASVSPSGKYIAYTSGVYTFRVVDLEKQQSYDVPLKTLAAKCAWDPHNEPVLICGVPKQTPSSAMPDSWLLGESGTSDALWQVTPTTGVATVVADPSTTDRPVDVSDVSIDDTGAYLIFTNKNDLSLWEVSLSTKNSQP